MSWTKLTKTDLTAALCAAEVEAFSQSAGFEDAAGALLAQTAAAVRGFVRAGGRPIPEGEGLVPFSLAPFAVDFAVFRLLKRFDVPVGEDRRRAFDAAMDVFKKVAAGQMAVEPAEGGAGAPSGPLPAFSAPRPARRLD